MSKLTKSQLIATLSEATDMSKKDVADFMDKLAGVVYKEVKTSGECIVPGFGKLVKAHRKARDGRNPATGETIKIPAKTVVKFRLAKVVKDTVL
ncbi:HU family DNA-binding protein [Candidatus Falkowbacteria bacterium]|uniref:Viral histone-like protein n=1 Tax=Candidatus Falkowbacteria bacterium CG10_big_fil_rev_8_21_14_0_10_37_18 TaxID=1974562 RepID=A0A2H0V9C4_9BACT|nr:HU family DNA-binding protein [Candidatus Falkowbacteria bacterium]NCQ13147.1 HU family DNA-binding protein [Candidatus Falkowbacteria bacterium]PIR95661.1 MAG: DNA-binding protein [Candidatus Falkowbacteria bacterium CG10_big_fil_rev_8_21_14_0_10_37_18]